MLLKCDRMLYYIYMLTMCFDRRKANENMQEPVPKKNSYIPGLAMVQPAQ
jgi:hypothetical protein